MLVSVKCERYIYDAWVSVVWKVNYNPGGIVV